MLFAVFKYYLNNFAHCKQFLDYYQLVFVNFHISWVIS